MLLLYDDRKHFQEHVKGWCDDLCCGSGGQRYTYFFMAIVLWKRMYGSKEIKKQKMQILKITISYF